MTAVAVVAVVAVIGVLLEAVAVAKVGMLYHPNCVYI